MAISTPTVGQSADSWGTTLNSALGSLQTQIENLDGLALAIGTVSQGAAAASIHGSAPNLTLDLTLPKGDTGTAPNITVGSVTSGVSPSATITGTSPNLTLNLVLPQGPSGTVSVGTVTTGAPGSSVAVTNSGSSSAAVLNFSIPKGDPGAGAVATVNNVAPVSGNVTLGASDVGAVSSTALAAANGVATLAADGTLVTSQLPALSITDTFTASSQAAMLALTAQKGDVCVRTDQSRTWILAADPATTLANWTQLPIPTDAVLSVNSQTGVVNLAAADVGALAASGTAVAATKLATARTIAGKSFDGTANITIAASDVSAVPTTRTVNAKALSADISLTASDVGALATASNLSDVASAATALGNLGGAASTGGAREKVAALSATTGTATGDLSAASVFTVTPTGNITLAFSNVPASGTACTVTVIVTQGGTVRTVALPSGGVWLGSAPTQVASKACVITLLTTNGGTTWYASAAVQA